MKVLTANLISLIQLCIFVTLFAKYGKSQATIGIDFGGKFIKVSTVTVSKPIQAVLDRDSNRKTLAVLGFKDGYLQFSGSAESLYRRTPELVVRDIYTLLGRFYDDDSIVNYRLINSRLNMTKNETTGGILIHFNKFNLTFTPIELWSIWIDEIMRYTAAYTSYSIADVLIAVDPTIDQARCDAIKHAAKISKINLMEITDNSRALATHYVLSRKQFLSSSKENVMFVDVGATNTIVTVARVGLIPGSKKNTTIPSFNITGIGFNAVGASDFDECIKNHLIEEFKKKHKISEDVSKLHKVNVKFMEQAVKAKHLLTSTKQIRLTIEDAYEYITFQTTFDRKTFEQTCAGILEKIDDAIDRAYQSSKLVEGNLNDVVIMGGGSLIPAVQAFIQKRTGLGPSRVLNTEESNAAGAAFLAAQKHKLFRVIEINSPSSIYYPIEVEYNISVANHEGVIETKSIRELLYPHLARTSAKKILTLTNVTENFIIRTRYSQFPVHLNIDQLDYRDIMDIHITGVKEALSDNSQHIFKHITVHFRIDSYRMLTVCKVEYFFEKNQTKSLFNKVGQAVMDLFRMNSNQTTDESLEKSDDSLDLPLNESLEQNQIDHNETLVPSPSGPKKENFTIPLPFKIEVLYLEPPNDDELFESSLKLKKLYQKEIARQADSKARSDLEHEIFETEKKLRDEELRKYFTDEEYDRAINVTATVKEIFDLEQHTFNSSVSNEKINQIKFAMSHGLNRDKNIKLINEHVFVLADIINKTHQLMAGAIQSDDLKKILNMTQVLDIYNVTVKTNEWLAAKLEQQKTLNLTDAPVLTISQLQLKINKLKNLGDSFYRSIQEGLNKLAKQAKDNKTLENDRNVTQTKTPDSSNITDEEETAKIDL